MSEKTKYAIGENPAILEDSGLAFVGHGLAFGKFMPPTKGHLHFLETARQSCRKLTIIVCSLPDEPIAGELRYKWIKELYPDCNVIHHGVEIQQEPKTSSDDPTGKNDQAFFENWRDSIYKHCPGETFDALFASETYGFRMADIMNLAFVPVDISRTSVPISGTEIRENPIKNWDYLPDVVKPYFLKKIRILAPQSYDKRPVINSLAKSFNTVISHDYLETYMNTIRQQFPDFIDNHMTEKTLAAIARGHQAGRKSLSKQANRFLLCESDIEEIVAFGEENFGENLPCWIKNASDDYDFYVVIEDDISNAPDPRFEMYKANILLDKKPHVIIRSSSIKNDTKKIKASIKKKFL